MDFNSLFGSRLKAERKRLGFNQAQIAKECGVSREMWGKYERGLAVPGGEVLFSFSRIGADIQSVMTGEDSESSLPPSLAPDEQMLVDAYRDMPMAKRKAMLAALLMGEELESKSKPEPKPKAKVKPKKPSGSVIVSGDGNVVAGENNNVRIAGRDYNEG